jgi:hypothetical protein
VRTGNFPVLDKNDQPGLVIQSDLIKKMVNAYHPIGIPIILGIKVPITTNGIHSYGYHAIAVLGHKVLQSDNPICQNDPWIANRLSKIYLHDDQFGPFASVKFLEDHGLKTPWTDEHVEHWPTQVISMVIPVYPKIRISYEDIETIVIALDQIIVLAFQNNFNAMSFWDIKINYSEDFKHDIIASALEDDEKIAIVDSNMPKYLWIATLYVGESKVYEFVFDATDVRSGMICRHVISYTTEDFNEWLRQYIETNKSDLEHFFITNGGDKYLDFFINAI